MEQRLGALHDKVVRRVLVNGGKPEDAPTAANIIDALGILGRRAAERHGGRVSGGPWF